jgi:hypothetical protein
MKRKLGKIKIIGPALVVLAVVSVAYSAPTYAWWSTSETLGGTITAGDWSTIAVTSADDTATPTIRGVMHLQKDVLPADANVEVKIDDTLDYDSDTGAVAADWTANDWSTTVKEADALAPGKHIVKARLTRSTGGELAQDETGQVVTVPKPAQPLPSVPSASKTSNTVFDTRAVVSSDRVKSTAVGLPTWFYIVPAVIVVLFVVVRLRKYRRRRARARLNRNKTADFRKYLEQSSVKSNKKRRLKSDTRRRLATASAVAIIAVAGVLVGGSSMAWWSGGTSTGGGTSSGGGSSSGGSGETGGDTTAPVRDDFDPPAYTPPSTDPCGGICSASFDIAATVYGDKGFGDGTNAGSGSGYLGFINNNYEVGATTDGDADTILDATILPDGEHEATRYIVVRNLGSIATYYRFNFSVTPSAGATDADFANAVSYYLTPSGWNSGTTWSYPTGDDPETGWTTLDNATAFKINGLSGPAGSEISDYGGFVTGGDNPLTSQVREGLIDAGGASVYRLDLRWFPESDRGDGVADAGLRNSAFGLTLHLNMGQIDPAAILPPTGLLQGLSDCAATGTTDAYIGCEYLSY